jgi:hypothetical protein
MLCATVGLVGAAGPAGAQTATTKPLPPGSGIRTERTADGSITRDSWLAAAKTRAEARFDALDTNHDGVLSKAELAAGRPKKTRATPAATPAN